MTVLDTCVISEALRPSPHPGVVRWLDSIPEETVYVPSLVLGELQKGVDLIAETDRRQAMEVWLHQLRDRFIDRVLPVDEGSATEWGHLCARLQRIGRPLPVVDSLLAAVVCANDAVLATRNVRHFEQTGVRLINPWDLA